MSEILNISILIIHRAAYKTTKYDDIRGEISDFIVSSTFCKAPNNYHKSPFLILYKSDKYDDFTYYYLVFNKYIIPPSRKSFYFKYDDLPDEIKILVDEHLRLDSKKEIPLIKEINTINKKK
jgi:hypothetical protein